MTTPTSVPPVVPTPAPELAEKAPKFTRTKKILANSAKVLGVSVIGGVVAAAIVNRKDTTDETVEESYPTEE